MMNAIIPGGLVIKESSGKVVVAKMASLSFTNDDGKPTPTIWKFDMKTKMDHDIFFALLHVFSRLALTVNNESAAALVQPPPARLPLGQIDINKKTPGKKKSTNKYFLSSPESSMNLLSDDDGSEDSDLRAPKCASYNSDKCESSVFAQSQDIYSSLGHRHPSFECFSPLADSDEE